MTDLATLDFTGADGTAVTGFDITNGGTVVIAGNKAVFKSNTSAWSPAFFTYKGLAARADSALYLEYTPSATIMGYLGISLRSPAAPYGYFPNGYSLYLSNGGDGSSVNYVVDGGNQQNLGYGRIPVVGVPNGVRFRVVGSTIQSKVWPLSEPEPVDWDVTVTDTNVTGAGYFAIQAVSAEGGPTPMTIDNVKITDGLVTVAPGTRGMPAFFQPQRNAKPVSPTMPTGVIVSNGRTFTPVFADDYNVDAKPGEVLSKYAVMTAYEGYVDTSNYGLYDPANVLSVHDGYLDIFMRTIDGQARVSAVNPNGYNGMTYGRVDTRYRVRTNGNGYKFVGILWPIDDDWNKGEIDWPEQDIPGGNRPASANPGSIKVDANGGQSMSFSPGREYWAPTDSSEFHVSTVEWTPEEIRCYWDGQLILTINKPELIPTGPMRPILQAESWIGKGPVPAATETHVDVDWIVIYAMTA